MGQSLTVYRVEAWKDILGVPLCGGLFLQEGGVESPAGQVKTLAPAWCCSEHGGPGALQATLMSMGDGEEN